MKKHGMRLAPAGALLFMLALYGCVGGRGGCGGGGSITTGPGPGPSPGANGQTTDALDAPLHPLNVGDVRAWRAADDVDGRRPRGS